MNVAIQAHALHIGVGDAGWQYLASLNCVLPLYCTSECGRACSMAARCRARRSLANPLLLDCSAAIPGADRSRNLCQCKFFAWFSFRSDV